MFPAHYFWYWMDEWWRYWERQRLLLLGSGSDIPPAFGSEQDPPQPVRLIVDNTRH